MNTNSRLVRIYCWYEVVLGPSPLGWYGPLGPSPLGSGGLLGASLRKHSHSDRGRAVILSGMEIGAL